MRAVLHILTQPEDALAREIISLQARLPEVNIIVADLTKEKPDYHALLEKVFAADSLTVW